VSFPEPMDDGAHKVRGKAERFADHYTQATLFWNSQTPVERTHIVNAFRFELSKVQTEAIRVRMVSGLMNVAKELAEAVAAGLGLPEMPDAMPKVMTKKVRPEVSQSPALSLFARPGDGSIRARRVAILVADGIVSRPLVALASRLSAGGAVAKFIGPKLGRATATDGEGIEIDAPVDAAPSVVFDAVVLPDGAAAVRALAADGRMLEFLKDQYRHCKPILVLGAASELIDKAGIPVALPSGDADPGLLVAKAGRPASDARTAAAFVTALAAHRHFARETDPPRV